MKKSVRFAAVCMMTLAFAMSTDLEAYAEETFEIESQSEEYPVEEISELDNKKGYFVEDEDKNVYYDDENNQMVR